MFRQPNTTSKELLESFNDIGVQNDHSSCERRIKLCNVCDDTFVSFINSCNNNEKFRSFKSKENIRKKEVGPYRVLSLGSPFGT